MIGIWEKQEDIADPELAKKPLGLPHLIRSAWADTTNAKYSRAWEKWVTWCEKYAEVSHCPADPFQIALYLFQ